MRSLRRRMLPHRPVGRGLPLPFSRPAVIRLKHCRGGSQIRPPSVDHDVRRARRLTGFRPLGEFLFPRRKRNQNAAGGGLRWASPPIVAPPPAPLFTGDTPTPRCKISGAQNTAPVFDSFRATGPWFCAKFRFVPFHSRAWFRPAVAEGAGSCPRRTAPFPRTGDGRVWDSPLRRTTAISEIRREGQAPPLRSDGETFCGGEQAGGHTGPPLRRFKDLS